MIRDASSDTYSMNHDNQVEMQSSFFCFYLKSHLAFSDLALALYSAPGSSWGLSGRTSSYLAHMVASTT